MRAGELARLLALLPEEMPVLVHGMHIDRIYKSGDETAMVPGEQEPDRCETGRCVVEWNYVEALAPAHIDLYGGVLGYGPSIGHPDPPVSLKAHGRARWPRQFGSREASDGR